MLYCFIIENGSHFDYTVKRQELKRIHQLIKMTVAFFRMHAVIQDKLTSQCTIHLGFPTV